MTQIASFSAMLLYTKCRIATAPPCGEARLQVLQSCCEALEYVKKNFSKVGAHVRLLQTLYLQVWWINYLIIFSSTQSIDNLLLFRDLSIVLRSNYYYITRNYLYESFCLQKNTNLQTLVIRQKLEINYLTLNCQG